MKDGSDFTRRLGRAALINLVPLCAGGRFNQIAHVLSSRPDNYLTLHKCIGLVFIIEASLHSILSWLRGDIDLRSWPDKAGLVAASSVGALVLLSIPVLWKWMYEPLSILHLALSVTMITSLWFHLPSASITQIPRLYLILAISIFSLIKLIFFLKLLFLNVSTELISTATIQQVGENGIEVRVTMPRPLRFRAGQFVFLSIPRLALFQYHPFQVAWEYLSDKGDGGRQVIVIIIQPRHGFTSRLRLAVPFKRYTALVEGPYGNPTKLDQYGTVLLFATGIGIAGQLPYMNEQLRLYREWRTKTRRHVLYWEIDAEEYRYWVNEWINEILSWNIDYDIQLYIRGRFLAKDAERGISVKKGEKLKRLTLNYDTMDPQSLLGDEIRRRKSGSRMLVSRMHLPAKALMKLTSLVCTDPITAQAVTKISWTFVLGQSQDAISRHRQKKKYKIAATEK
ncbi:hypothetical protein DER44DRAFT_748545 [Fusarium oxysporum]|nr:hypothetical protein DER44DRAFT_748545 [Fusarium oxysporum]